MINLPVHYFKPSRYTNFGDELVPIILKWLEPEGQIEYVPRNYQGKYLCIGSELASGILRPSDIVWGYGAKYHRDILKPKTARILAVRGPMTRELIHTEVPEVYGDPAIFMPDIYTPAEPDRRYEIGVIPHYVDLPRFLDLENDPGIKVISVLGRPFDIIDQIHACDMIISTSLHGCIVAEAYGKPVVWLQISDRIQGAAFKFNDYFLGSGRGIQEPVRLALTRASSIRKAAREQFWIPAPEHNKRSLLMAWRNQWS